MNYIVYDLEFNQKNHSSEDNNNILKKSELKKELLMPFEIIQIGALKLDSDFNTISTFNSLIKPVLYKSIHPHVEELTKINNEKITSSNCFPNVYEDFLNFLGDEEAIFCVWGVVDIKELIRNLKFYNLSTSYINKYIDIQKYASKHLKLSGKSRIGLKNATDLLNIQTAGEFHDAFNDAYYTAEIFKHIYDKNVIKPSIYTFSNPTRINKPKEKIDAISLINQFKKIYNREMTEEEVNIIKLAYIMGKTRQFIIETPSLQKDRDKI